LPGKDIRWSVAMEPAISSDMLRNTTGPIRWNRFLGVPPGND
jgi:hypothetical protein